MRLGHSTGAFDWAWAESRFGQLPSGRSQFVALNRDVPETGADVDTAIIRAVDQLKRAHLLARELEHCQAGIGPKINAPDLLIPERGVEAKRGGQVGHPIRSVTSPHRQ